MLYNIIITVNGESDNLNIDLPIEFQMLKETYLADYIEKAHSKLRDKNKINYHKLYKTLLQPELKQGNEAKGHMTYVSEDMRIDLEEIQVNYGI